jgi:3-oxoacyl-[acyl-carrier protein] reductase
MEIMEQNLKGKVALVTGAAGVLGLATCKALLDDGLKVVLVDLNEDCLQQLAADLPGEVYPITVDISDITAVKAAHQRIEQEFGSVDVLVNNAGLLSNNKIEETTAAEWARVMGANLDGAFYWSQAVIPHMKAQRWGRIINTCSLASKSGGLTAGTVYTTSKGALVALTFSIARETAAFGITCNGIAPAYVKSPMVTEQLTDAQQQKLLKQIPVGRFCEPEEFAHVVSFLVSPLSGFITGEIIDQNGGLHFD